MVTLTNVGTILIAFTFAANAPVTQPSPDAGTVFVVYAGWDMNNGFTQATFGGTELACLEARSASELRKHFTLIMS